MESESEGGQKFLPPNPLPFCPPERLDFKIKSSDFRQKMFELRSKNTALSFVKKANKNDILLAVCVTIFLFTALIDWNVYSWLILLSLIMILFVWYFKN